MEKYKIFNLKQLFAINSFCCENEIDWNSKMYYNKNKTNLLNLLLKMKNKFDNLKINLLS